MKILIISSQYTGFGHKSITESFKSVLEKYDDVELSVVDGFTFLGKRGVNMSKSYNRVTQKAVFLWDEFYRITKNNSIVPKTFGPLIRRNAAKYIRENRPDLIISIHSGFVSSILDTLEKKKLHVPLMVMQADMDNLHKTWCDRRAVVTFCPTKEAVDCSLRFGMPEERLVQSGFPVRKEFCDFAGSGKISSGEGGRINALLMGGGAGAGKMHQYCENILKETDARLTVICGSNNVLKEELEKTYAAYGERLNVLGYVTDMAEVMSKADIAFTRGSPNCISECIMMGLPMIVTGALPGQEAKNPDFVISRGVGILCTSPENAGETLKRLTADDGKLMKEIRQKELLMRDPMVTEKIVEKIMEVMKK